MPASLKQLAETTATVDVQQTTFSIDVLGRFVSSTWEEATANGGPPFDVVVIGSGMYGAYCAAKLYRFVQHRQLRILLLEAGSFLVSEHIQNLARIGLYPPDAVIPAAAPRTARNLVWGIPWLGQDAYPGLAYCVGGKSLFWGGWCPRLTAVDLQRWPAVTRAYLTTTYPRLEVETGVDPDTDFIMGSLYTTVRQIFAAAAPNVANIEGTLGTNGIEPPPLAVQGEAPASGLFSFDKFSSAPILVEAIREDIESSGLNDANRRLFLVPRVHVAKLHTANGVVQEIELFENGRQRFLHVGNNCTIVLALSTIETTRLALESFPTALMGRNLMAHVRSDFVLRIRRSALPPLPQRLETAAILVRGVIGQARFHLQITASANTAGSDALLFRLIPDLDLLEQSASNADPSWIAFTVRAIGEMVGDRTSAVPNSGSSWINLSPYERDEFGFPRAYVQFRLSPADQNVWSVMDHTALALVQQVAGAAGNIEYLYDSGWKAAPPPLGRPYPEWHWGLGTTYHEAGTLWMGDAAQSSVTDPTGRFHHVQNAYACDQSLFPTVGSVNPVLTGLTLAHQIATKLSGP